jgi:hypothetical protein
VKHQSEGQLTFELSINIILFDNIIHAAWPWSASKKSANKRAEDGSLHGSRCGLLANQHT